MVCHGLSINQSLFPLDTVVYKTNYGKELIFIMVRCLFYHETNHITISSICLAALRPLVVEFYLYVLHTHSNYTVWLCQ